MPSQLVVSANGHTDIVQTGPVGPPGQTGPEGPPGIQGVQGPQGLGSEGLGIKMLEGVVTDIGGTEYQVFDFTNPEENWAQFAIMPMNETRPDVQRYLLDLPDPNGSISQNLPFMTMVIISYAGSITENFTIYMRSDGGAVQAFPDMKSLWLYFISGGWRLNLSKLNSTLFGSPPPGEDFWWIGGDASVNPYKGAIDAPTSEGDPSTTTVADISIFGTQTVYVDAGGAGQDKVEILLTRVYDQEARRFTIYNAEDVETIDLLADDGYGTPHTRTLTGADLEKVRTSGSIFEFVQWPNEAGVDDSFVIDPISSETDLSLIEDRLDIAESNITNHDGRILDLEEADTGDWGGFSTPTLPWHATNTDVDATPEVELNHGYAIEEVVVAAADADVDFTWTNPGEGKIARQQLKLKAPSSIGTFNTPQSDIMVNAEGWPTVASTWSLYDIWIVGQDTEYVGDPAAVYVNTLMHNITFGT